MDCEKMMDIYLELDRSEAIPGILARHMAACPRCSREIRELEKVFQDCSEAGNIPPPRDATADVMARIADLEGPPGREHSLGNWIGTGLVIILGMLLIPFSTILPSLYRLFGPGVMVALHVIMGVTLTAYMLVFIVCHMRSLRRLLRL